MQIQSVSNFNFVSIITFIIITIIYYLFGIIGYLSFCNNTKIDILQNYSYKNPFITFSRFTNAVVIASSYIMSAFSARFYYFVIIIFYRIAFHKLLDCFVFYVSIKCNKIFYNFYFQKSNLLKVKNYGEELQKWFPSYFVISWGFSALLWFITTYYFSKYFHNGTPIVVFLGGSSCLFSLIIPGLFFYIFYLFYFKGFAYII